MSYIKVCQIIDTDTQGENYLEDVDKNVINNKNFKFPLTVSIEIIDWGDERNFKFRRNKHQNEIGQIETGPDIIYHSEELIIPKNSFSSIRDYVYKQLLSKYPDLIP